MTGTDADLVLLEEKTDVKLTMVEGGVIYKSEEITR